MTRDEIPDLEWVVKDAAQARQSQTGIDPAAPQVQNVLAKIEVARDAAHLLQEQDSLFLSKGPLKRNMPGEGETRAAELHRFLEGRIIPAVNAVILVYGELKAATAHDASSGSDSEDSVSSDANSDWP